MDPNLELAIRSEILGRMPQSKLSPNDMQYLSGQDYLFGNFFLYTTIGETALYPLARVWFTNQITWSQKIALR